MAKPKTKLCNHDWDYSIYLNEVKNSGGDLIIKSNCILISTCKLCDEEVNEVCTGGVIFKESINK